MFTLELHARNTHYYQIGQRNLPDRLCERIGSQLYHRLSTIYIVPFLGKYTSHRSELIRIRFSVYVPTYMHPLRSYGGFLFGGICLCCCPPMQISATTGSERWLFAGHVMDVVVEENWLVLEGSVPIRGYRGAEKDLRYDNVLVQSHFWSRSSSS